MVHITADETTLIKDLDLFVEPVEIHDASGKFLGLFVPANLERDKQLYAALIAQTDWVEIERREQAQDPGRTTVEVMERLQAMEKAGLMDSLPA